MKCPICNTDPEQRLLAAIFNEESNKWWDMVCPGHYDHIPIPANRNAKHVTGCKVLGCSKTIVRAIENSNDWKHIND